MRALRLPAMALVALMLSRPPGIGDTLVPLVNPEFEPLLPIARTCLRGPHPDAVCALAVETACHADRQDDGDPMARRLTCARASAQVWGQMVLDLSAVLNTMLFINPLQGERADNAAFIVAGHFSEAWKSWRQEHCELERRLGGGGDLELLTLYECRARLNRNQAIRLQDLIEVL